MHSKDQQIYNIRKCNNIALNISIFAVICKIKKKLLIYKRYIYNSGQSDFDLFADYIEAKIIIVFTRSLDFFGY